MKQIDLKDQYFGTEIEMTGISRYDAAAAVGRMFGTEPYHIRSYDSWCVKDSDGKTWKFSRDSSIDCERLANGTVIDADGDYSTEMVSPKLEYSEMGKLQEVVRDNPAFTFRTFLLRLGLIGDEYKNVRKHLLANLDGDKAWRYDKSTYACLQKPGRTDDAR